MKKLVSEMICMAGLVFALLAVSLLSYSELPAGICLITAFFSITTAIYAAMAVHHMEKTNK